MSRSREGTELKQSPPQKGVAAPSAVRAARGALGVGRIARAPGTWLFLAFSALYALTLFPGVGGTVNRGDSSKFQFIGHVLGVSHPPGNPLYMLLDATWVRLPIPLSMATRVTLLSTVFALLTLHFVYRTITRLIDARAGVIGAVALGTGSLFWTFATEAEVYTLNTSLLAIAIYYAACFADDGKERTFLLGALFYVLGFANHLTSVALLPAFLWLAFVRVRQGSGVRLRSVAIVFAFILLSSSFYLYVPWRAHAGATYSELEGPLSAQTFFEYITAKKFHGSFGHFSVRAGVRDRMPALLQFLQKQWLWPMLFIVPVGMRALHARAPLFSRVVVIGAVSLLVFAFGYDIPDPEGFYMPIVVLLTIAIGAASTVLLRARPILTWVAFAILVTIPANAHIAAWSKRSGFEVYEDMGNETGVAMWDLDDLFQRIPSGGRFAVPCNHYGCVEVVNYYRYADPVVQKRGIGFVRLPSNEGSNLDIHTKLDAIEYEEGRHSVVCSIRKPDADAMRERGILIDEIYRPARDIREGTKQGVTIYCSHPGR